MKPLLLLFCLTAASPAAAGVLLSSGVKTVAGLPTGWEPMTFKKIEAHTAYSWDEKSGVLHAVSKAAASGLIYRLKGDALKTPTLSWSWKVAGVLKGGNAREKDGDDYPARIYVTFKYDPEKASRGMRFKYGLAKRLYGEYPPHAGINYIWANQLPRGEAVANAFTDRVQMIAVRSGAKEAGQWFSEERDILADYRRLFGEEPPELAGIALMSDTDNTGESAEAWFKDIRLEPRTAK